MITRREFLEYAGASVAVFAVAPTLGTLKPFLLDDERHMLPAPATASSTVIGNLPRIAYSYSMTSGWMTWPPEDDQSRRNLELLQYFSTLGYTHFLCNMYWSESLFQKNALGHWIYNNGNYREGAIAKSLRAMKAAVESEGVNMRLIPYRACLSWTFEYFGLDPSISEFRSEASFRTWVEQNGLPTWNGLKVYEQFPLGRVAYVGPNQGMDDIFNEYMKIIKSNWAFPKATTLGGPTPKYVLIAHDELGDYWACCIKADKSRDLPGTKSQLVAAEINKRVRKIRSTFGTNTKVMIFGDSLLPADNGEIYDLIGHPVTGKGGVLQLLRDKHRVANSLIVMPWTYSFRDGMGGKTADPNGNIIPFSKVRQLAYLDRLKIRYIPCTGEDGPLPLSDWGMIHRTTETTFEWVRAAQMFPDYLAGFAHLGFNDGIGYPGCDAGTGYCIHYAASLLAYLVWAYGERSLRLSRHNVYSPRIFSRVRADLSSRERKWTEGVHYSPPRLIGSLLSTAGR